MKFFFYTFFYFSGIFFLTGAVTALILYRRPRWGNFSAVLFSVLGALSASIFSIYVIISGDKVSLSLGSLAGMGSFAFYIDPLSAFFILTLSVISIPVSIYSIGYNKEYFPRGNFPYLGFFHNIFLFSMTAVVSANDILTFLIAWEVMSLVSYFLVVFEHEKKEAVNAGLLYIIMTHIGTAFIIVLFLLMAQKTGTMSFDSFRLMKNMPVAALKNIIFACALFGFGAKAGIIPLHIWLPKAHPSAPSSISALMSGVMIKTAVYGIVRVVFDFLGAGNAWWGVIMVSLALISAVLGAMYAMQERDIKRLLAFCSIENIGIIFVGVGASIIFASQGLSQFAAIALIAGLYHLLNHAVFKGLLFLGAGSVLHGTHTKNMEELGGLIKRMPKTAFLFLIGSIAISGFPPFNGFVSEWMTFQSLLAGFQSVDIFMKIFFVVCAALLALTGALAAAGFVKAFGITFLGLPRSAHAENANESPFSMLAGMTILGVLCLVLGIFPGIMFKVLSEVAYSFLGNNVYSQLYGLKWLSISPLNIKFAGVSTAMIFVILLFFAVGIILFIRLFYGRTKDTIGATWDCGTSGITPRMEYTGTAFSQPLKIIFKAVYMPVRNVEFFAHDIQPYFRKVKLYEHNIQHVFERCIYRPLAEFILENSIRIINLQAGSIHLYLAYILVVLIGLLLFVR